MSPRFSFFASDVFEHVTALKLELHMVQEDQLAILFELKGCFCPDTDEDSPVAEDLARSLLTSFLAKKGGLS